MCGIMIMFSAFTTQTVEGELIDLLSEPDKFLDFTYLGFLSTQYGNVVAITVFLVWIKLFKYLTFNKTMIQLTKTLSRVEKSQSIIEGDESKKKLSFQCAKDMAGFGVMFFIAFFSYALLGLVLFGPDVSPTLLPSEQGVFFQNFPIGCWLQ